MYLFIVKKPVQINIPNPCSENWDHMLPAERGRFCNACEKVVTDFTGMTDKEIIRFFKQHKQEHICGRYLSTQVNRPIAYKEQIFSRLGKWPIKRIAAIFLFLETMANDALAQKVKPAHVITSNNKVRKPTHANPNEITGHVLDELTKAPIKGISVSILNTDIVAITDRQGRFKMALTEGMIYSNATLYFNAFYADPSQEHAGFAFIDKSIDADTLLKEKSITLYRYPVDTLAKVTTRRQAITLQREIIMGAGGGPEPEIIIKKIHWYDPKYWFRKRRAS